MDIISISFKLVKKKSFENVKCQPLTIFQKMCTFSVYYIIIHIVICMYIKICKQGYLNAAKF